MVVGAIICYAMMMGMHVERKIIINANYKLKVVTTAYVYLLLAYATVYSASHSIDSKS